MEKTAGPTPEGDAPGGSPCEQHAPPAAGAPCLTVRHPAQPRTLRLYKFQPDIRLTRRVRKQNKEGT